MAPRFRVEHSESIQVMNMASRAQHGAALTISFNFPAHHSFMPYFGAFSFGFYNVSSIQVPLQQQQVVTAEIIVAIFQLLLLGWIVQNN